MKILLLYLLFFYTLGRASNGQIFHSVGCYRDNEERDLGSMVNSSDQMTIEKCISICFENNKPFAGLQFW